MRKAVGVPFQDKVSARYGTQRAFFSCACACAGSGDDAPPSCHRCTAKINESMRFKRGRGISKLKAVLTAAQVANPAVEDKPKHNFVFSNPSAPPKPDKMVEAPEEDLEEVEEEEESVVEAMLDINETVMEAEAEDTNQLIPSKKDKRRYANRPSKRKKTVFF
ncbi:unnamed protein product [Chrysoparadoxa australica]